MKLERQAQQYFFDVLDAMSPQERELLYKTTSDDAAVLYLWDPISQVARSAQYKKVPWFTVYALSFSSKHIFGNPGRLSISAISRHVEEWRVEDTMASLARRSGVD